MSSLLALPLVTTAACGDDDGGDDPQPDASTADASTDSDASTDTDAASTESATLSNVDLDCEITNLVGPVLPDEAGHYYAASITPTSYPFEVTDVSYFLAQDDDQCNSGLAHEVLVFKSTTAQPSNTPSEGEVQVIEVPAGQGADDRLVELALDTPITLEDGELIVVAVQLPSEGAESVCLSACDAMDTEEDWWSNATAEPYSWADMVGTFGFTVQAPIRVEGTVAP